MSSSRTCTVTSDALRPRSTTLDCRRTRLYGERLRRSSTAGICCARGVDMVVPERLFTAPLPVVAAYLRSIFQAEGYVSARESARRSSGWT